MAGNSAMGFIDGSAFIATFNGPSGIVIDSAGVNLFVTCRDANSIRQVVIATGYVTTLVGAGASPFIKPKYSQDDYIVKFFYFFDVLKLIPCG